MRRTQAVHVTIQGTNEPDSLLASLLTTTGRATAVLLAGFQRPSGLWQAWRGAAWLGLAWRGTAGAAGPGVAWLGMAGLGAAGREMGSGFGSGPLLWDTEDTEK
jgi:hypothetical protein